MTPQEVDPDLPVACPGVSGEGVGQQKCSCYRTCTDILKEVTIIFITSTMVWSQVKQQGGNTALPIKQIIGLKIYQVWPRPSEQNLVSIAVSLSYQEASISL